MEPTKAQHFKEVVEQIFNRWTALKLCVEHGMGGKNGQQTAIEIMNYMYEYCTTNENLSQYDVQSVLEEIMDQEFEAICDDNSITEISAHLLKYLNMCNEERYAEITQELNQLPKCSSWLTPQFQMKYVASDSSDSDDDDDDGEDDDDDDDQMEESSSSVPKTTTKAKASSTMETDEDGWTTVPTRKRH